MRFQEDSPRTSGGRYVILNRTECSSVDWADGPLFLTERSATRWTGRTVCGLFVDSLQDPRGQSAGPTRTVRGVLADGPPGPTVSSASR
jgi:hypothetical protein